MKRIAAPMIGGVFTSFLLELMVYPAIYEIWKWNFEIKKAVEPVPPFDCNIERRGFEISEKRLKMVA